MGGTNALCNGLVFQTQTQTQNEELKPFLFFLKCLSDQQEEEVPIDMTEYAREMGRKGHSHPIN